MYLWTVDKTHTYTHTHTHIYIYIYNVCSKPQITKLDFSRERVHNQNY